MKLHKKRTIILVVAMIMTIAMVTVVYAAEYVYPQAWNDGTGRYTQVYEMNTGTNWRLTFDVNSNQPVEKMYSNRDCLVQCTSNGLMAFPTYYRVYMGDGNIYVISEEFAITGTGTNTGKFDSSSYGRRLMFLGIRNDPRYNSTVTNIGNWSPDTF